MSKKLPKPTEITADAVREILEKNGYEVVPGKQFAIDLLELMVPLLTMLQWVQWWGKLCELNNIKVDYGFDSELFGITVHAASEGQQIGVVPVNSLGAVLNMPQTWFANLRRYSDDPQVRRERLEDDGLTQLSNEMLDENGRFLLHMLSLLLPPKRETCSEESA